MGSLGLNSLSSFPTMEVDNNGLPTGQVTYTCTSVKRLTDEEKLELQELEKEEKEFITHFRKNLFRNLSAATREKTIDEVISYEFNNELDSVSYNNDRLSELRRIRNCSAINIDNYQLHVHARENLIPPILNYFTKEELIDIHKQATLEETLL